MRFLLRRNGLAPGNGFERQFSLADHVEVEGATFENGLLQIDLVRKVPEAMQPRVAMLWKM